MHGLKEKKKRKKRKRERDIRDLLGWERQIRPKANVSAPRRLHYESEEIGAAFFIEQESRVHVLCCELYASDL